MSTSRLSNIELEFLTTGATQTKLTSSPSLITLEGVGGNRCTISNVQGPVLDYDAINKAYVDAVAVGLFWKIPCRLATTTTITLSGNQNIDGILTIDGDRILVKDQGGIPSNINNGIYIADSGAWTRSFDYNVGLNVNGSAIFITEGTINQDIGFVQISSPAIVGTNALEFTQFGTVTPPGGTPGDVQFNDSGVFGGISDITTNGTTQLNLSDNAIITLGSSSDLTFIHNTTDSVITSNTNNLLIDNTNATGNTQLQVGSDTNDTDVRILTNSGDFISKFYGNRESTFFNELTIQGNTTQTTTITTINTASNVTYTASQLLGGFIKRDPNGAPRLDIPDTAANIVASIHDCVVGSSFTTIIFNTSIVSGEGILLGVNTGVTKDPNTGANDFTLTTYNRRAFTFIVTNIGSGTEAVVIYSNNNLVIPGGDSGDVQFNDSGIFGGISGVTTNGTTDLNLSDNTTMTFGDSQDLTIVYDATNSEITSNTNNLLIDNTNATGSTQLQLGSDTNDTELTILDDTGNDIFKIQGAGKTEQFNQGTLIPRGSVSVSAPELFQGSADIKGDILFIGGYNLLSGSVYGIYAIDVRDKDNPNIIDTFGDQVSCNRLKIDNDVLYVLNGPGFGFFTLLDISDPSNMTLIRFVNTVSTSFDIYGKYIFTVNEFSNSISTFDISEPIAMSVVSTFTDATNLNNPVSIEIQDSYAYIITSDKLTIIDISNPLNLTFVSSIIDARIETVNLKTISHIVRNNFVYYANENFFVIFDVSDKLNIIITGTITNDFSYHTQISAIINDTLYLATEEISGFGGSDAVYAIDVSDPTTPAIITDNSIIGAKGVMSTAFGNYLYVANRNDETLQIYELNGTTLTSTQTGNLRCNGNAYFDRDLNVRGDVQINTSASIGGSLSVNNSLSVNAPETTFVVPTVDFINTTNINIPDNCNLNIGNSSDLVLRHNAGSNSTITSTTNNLLIDNTNTTGSTQLQLGSDTNAVSVDIIDDSGNDLFNVQGEGRTEQYTSGTLIERGSLTDNTNLSNITMIDIQGDVIYFGARNNPGVFVGCIDVSNPDNPTFIYELSAGSSNYIDGLKCMGKYMFVSELFGDRVVSYDISDPSNMINADLLTDGTALNGCNILDIMGNHMFVACSSGNQLTAVDISNPNLMTITSSIVDATDLSNNQFIVIQGKYAYCSAIGNNRKTIVDISDPSSMTIIGSLSDASYAGGRGICVRGSYLYSGGSSFFTITNIEDKTTPVIEGSLAGDFRSRTISIVGNIVYVIMEISGVIKTVDVSDSTTPTLIATNNTNASYTNNECTLIRGNYLYGLSYDNNTLYIYELNGTTLTSTQTGNLYTRGNTYFDKGVKIEGRLDVYSGAIINNSLAVMSNTSVHNDLTVNGQLTINALNVKNAGQVTANNGTIIINNNIKQTSIILTTIIGISGTIHSIEPFDGYFRCIIEDTSDCKLNYLIIN